MERSRFDYVAYDEKSVELQTKIKEKCQELESLMFEAQAQDSIELDHSPQFILANRWYEEYMMNLEYTYMASGKYIRDIQIGRDPGTKLQEERKDI